MKVEDMADAINKYLDILRLENNSDKKSFFLVRKYLEPIETFKAFKLFNTELWLIDGESKTRVITSQVTGKMVEGRDEAFLKQVDGEFIVLLIDFIVKGKLNEYI